MQEQLWNCSQRSTLRHRGCGLILAKASLTLPKFVEGRRGRTDWGDKRLGVDIL